MKGLKLFLGVVSVCMACYCGYLALSSEISDAMMMGESAGITLGLAVCIAMLAAGIVGIAGRAARRGTIAAGVLYLLVFVVGIVWHGTDTWMLVEGFSAFVCACVFLCHGAWIDGVKAAA